MNKHYRISYLYFIFQPVWHILFSTVYKTKSTTRLLYRSQKHNTTLQLSAQEQPRVMIHHSMRKVMELKDHPATCSYSPPLYMKDKVFNHLAC